MNKLEVKFLGGAREVGRSAIVVSYKDTRVLLDYGVMLNDHPEFPGHVEPRKIDAVLLTHAHLDHSGSIPMLYISGRKPRLYATRMTKDTADILLSDFIKLSGYYLPFGHEEMREALNRCTEIYYREPFTVKDLEIEFIDAGHIPGSAQILVKGDKTIAYTGDFTTIRSKMLDGADTSLGDVDALIIESTYALEEHPERTELERSFVEACKEVVENGGNVLVPAFSVGRAQEVLCILHAYGFKQPVWLDGMARKTLEKYLEDNRFIDNYHLLKKASKRIRIVTGKRGRRAALSEPGVIITPAGMLKGGPALFYANKIIEDPSSAIFLVSFQLPGTPGAQLLEERKLQVNGEEKTAKCRVEQFRFSGHAGKRQLHEYIRNLETARRIFAIHGEEQACQELATWTERETGAEATAPTPQQAFTI
ncbi:MAG TPA: MBL fold metallo-hydrolase [Candidatus Caldiarchaeum subterraneum]|uniref:MBL fold metallo-hydrolase n=1 Tax=Caldiarchaeum subterraneum TaxID=311458 RepID=A0A832ZVB7_CALS0|nr:MBL fold metallo-hydrolase [Candidatus Caldarchaeum subterraneum]